MVGRIRGRTDRWTHERMHGGTDIRLDGHIDGWMDAWTNERMDICIDRQWDGWCGSTFIALSCSQLHLKLVVYWYLCFFLFTFCLGFVEHDKCQLGRRKGAYPLLAGIGSVYQVNAYTVAFLVPAKIKPHRSVWQSSIQPLSQARSQNCFSSRPQSSWNVNCDCWAGYTIL